MGGLEEINWEDLASSVGKDVFVKAKVLNTRDIRMFSKQLTFKCNDCNEKMTVQVSNPFEKPNYPKKCSKCNSKNIVLVKEEGEYEEYQEVVVTDLNEKSNRKLSVILIGKEFVNSLSPGDIVYLEGYLYPKISKSAQVKPILMVKRMGTKEKDPKSPISKSKLMRVLPKIIGELQGKYNNEEGVPVEFIINEITSRYKISDDDVKECLETLANRAEIYQPVPGRYKSVEN